MYLIICLQSNNDLFNSSNEKDILTNNFIIQNNNKEIKDIGILLNEFKSTFDKIKNDHENYKNYCFDLLGLIKSIYNKTNENDFLLNSVLINENLDKIYNTFITNDQQNKNALRKIYHDIHTIQTKINEISNNNISSNNKTLESKIVNIENQQTVIINILNEILQLTKLNNKEINN